MNAIHKIAIITTTALFLTACQTVSTRPQPITYPEHNIRPETKPVPHIVPTTRPTVGARPVRPRPVVKPTTRPVAYIPKNPY